jgi:hypothetical protein
MGVADTKGLSGHVSSRKAGATKLASGPGWVGVRSGLREW